MLILLAVADRRVSSGTFKQKSALVAPFLARRGHSRGHLARPGIAGGRRELGCPVMMVLLAHFLGAGVACIGGSTARVGLVVRVVGSVMIPIALLLFTVVMVALLDLVLRVEEVKDHGLHSLLLLRVTHLLNLAVELGRVRLSQLLLSLL